MSDGVGPTFIAVEFGALRTTHRLSRIGRKIEVVLVSRVGVVAQTTYASRFVAQLSATQRAVVELRNPAALSVVEKLVWQTTPSVCRSGSVGNSALGAHKLLALLVEVHDLHTV